MNGLPPLDLALFVIATFAAGVVVGIAGFAFAVVAAAVWLHILTPQQTATIIIVFALLTQVIAVWQLRHALSLRRLWPFLVGGALGVPLGVELLRWGSPAALRIGIGVVLVLYSLYGLFRPRLKPVGGGAAADAVVGFLSGILSGAAALPGILPTVWCELRRWSKDEQRAVFQPLAVAYFVMTALWLGGTGALALDVAPLLALGFPALVLGTWLGLRLYGRLDETGFRRVVLVLLLLSGLSFLTGW